MSVPVVEIERGGDTSGWRARVQGSNGHFVTLHSRCDPLGEAHLQLATVQESEPEAVVLIGAGLGYIVEAARDRWPSARLIVFEPSAELAQHAAARTPSLFADGRIEVLTGPAFDGADRLWRFFDGPAEPVVAVVVHPVLALAMPEPIARAKQWLRRAIAAGRMNARARRDNATRYLCHTLQNLPLVARSADPAALFGRFDGVPAVITAAGPSLDRALGPLRALADRALLIATDTTWRPLVSAGIEPPLVVAVDPTEMNGRHLENVNPVRPTRLLVEASVHPASLQSCGAQVAAFRVADHPPWPWLAAAGLQRPRVRAWGSVLTAALDLALSFDCDPIVFVGADLAYTGGRPYCRGTTFEQDWAGQTAKGVSLQEVWRNLLSSRRTVTVTGVDGEPVTTAPHLLEFRDWIAARTLEYPGRRFLNATGAGALHGGSIVQATLHDALEGHAARGDALRRLIESALVPVPQKDLCGAIDALLSGERADGSREVLRSWMEFAGPGLSLDRLREILTAVRAELKAGATIRRR